MTAETYAGLLSDVAIRGSLLLLLAWLGSLALRRAAPAVRLAVWTTVVLGALSLPVLTVLLPPLEWLPPVTTSQPTPASGAASSLTSDLAPTVVAASSALHSTSPRITVTVPKFDPAGRFIARHTEALLLALWLIGALAVIGGLGLGLWRLRRLAAKSGSAPPAIVVECAALRVELGIRRPVEVRISPLVSSPATWGALRPIVMLPAEVDRWSRERRRLVLTHELVHVARHDWVVRLLARLACALYWYNPTAWLALGRLRIEQEMACDLAVVEAGTRPSTYAQHLLAIARAARGLPAVPLPALDMARRSQMEGRLMSILTERAPHRRRGALLVPILLVIAVPLLAAARPAPPPPAPDAPDAPDAPEAPEAPDVRDAPEAPEAPATPALPKLAPVAPWTEHEGGEPRPAPAPQIPTAPAAPVRPQLAPTPPTLPSPATLPSPPVVPTLATSPSAALAPSAPRPRATPGAEPEPTPEPLAESGPAPLEPKLAPRPRLMRAPAGVPSPVLAPQGPAAMSLQDDAIEGGEAVPQEPRAQWMDHAEWREFESRMEAEMAALHEQMAPIQAEIERVMEESLRPVLAEIEVLELEMEPVHSELARLGAEVGAVFDSVDFTELESDLGTQELAGTASTLAELGLEARRLRERLEQTDGEEANRIRARLSEIEASRERLESDLGERQATIAARHREMAEKLRERAGERQERMRELEIRMEPRRERMEALQRQLEMQRTDIWERHHEQMEELSQRMEALGEEFRTRMEERVRAWQQQRDEDD